MFSENFGNWKKVAAGFGIFGFILSLITGLIGDVGFGAVFLRALLFAGVFAGVSLLLMKMIEKYIPELLGSYDSEQEFQDSDIIIENAESEQQENVNGSNLDITIDDDETEVLEEFEAAESADAAEPEAAVAEEVAELESLEPVDDAPAAAAQNGDDTQELPDIGAYSDSFDATPGSAGLNGDGLSNIDGPGGAGSSAEILGGMHDTGEIVKAVKTVLKKDQEG